MRDQLHAWTLILLDQSVTDCFGVEGNLKGPVIPSPCHDAKIDYVLITRA